jgi:hypothetical protein
MAYIPPNPNGQAPSASSSPVVIASDQSAIPTQAQGNAASGTVDSGNPVKVGGVYNTSLPSLSTGQRADLQLDATGRLITNPRALSSTTDSVQAIPVVGTSGGWTPSSQTALSNTVQAIKSSAGQLGGLDLFNPNSTTVYIQFFNAATGSVTVGITAPTFVKALPAGAAANINYGAGITFNTAISWAATTTATGNTAPSSALTGFALYA